MGNLMPGAAIMERLDLGRGGETWHGEIRFGTVRLDLARRD